MHTYQVASFKTAVCGTPEYICGPVGWQDDKPPRGKLSWNYEGLAGELVTTDMPREAFHFHIFNTTLAQTKPLGSDSNDSVRGVRCRFSSLMSCIKNYVGIRQQQFESDSSGFLQYLTVLQCRLQHLWIVFLLYIVHARSGLYIDKGKTNNSGRWPSRLVSLTGTADSWR